MTPNYTDYLGQPVHVGDLITYPTCSGSSAANLNLGVILEIDDIIPDDPNDLKNFHGSLHKDRNKAYPPRRRITGRWQKVPGSPLPGGQDALRDDSKAYQLVVRRLREGYGGWRIWTRAKADERLRKVTVKNVDRIVVVSRLANGGMLEEAASLFHGVVSDAS